MGDSSQAQLMVKDQEPIAALEGMEKMAEAKSMKPQAKCILGGQVLQVRVQVQVHIHGYTLVTGEAPEKDIMQVRVHVYVHGHVQVHVHVYTLNKVEVPKKDRLQVTHQEVKHPST